MERRVFHFSCSKSTEILSLEHIYTQNLNSNDGNIDGGDDDDFYVIDSDFMMSFRGGNSTAFR